MVGPSRTAPMLLLPLLACGVAPKSDGQDPADTAPPTVGCSIEGARYAAGADVAEWTWSLTYGTDGELLTQEQVSASGRWVSDWTYVNGCATTLLVHTELADEGASTADEVRAYTCDDRGNHATIAVEWRDPDDVTTHWAGAWTRTYDGADILTESYAEDGDYGPAGYQLTNTWRAGLLVQADYDDGHQAWTTLNDYDGGGLLVLSRWYGNGQEARSEYEYDDAGRTSVYRYGQLADEATTQSTVYTYEDDEIFYTDAVQDNGVRYHQDVDCG